MKNILDKCDNSTENRILYRTTKNIAAFLAGKKELFKASLRYGILNFAIFCCIGIYYRSQAYINEKSLIGELYTIIMFLGLPGCLALIIGMFTAIAALFNKTAMRIAGGILSTFCITFLLIDAIVFTQYKFHIESTMLALFFSEAGTELISFSWSMFLMAAAGLLAIIAAVCGMMYTAEKFNKPLLTGFSTVCTIIILLGIPVFHIWHAAVTFHGETAMLERNQLFPCNIGITAKRLMRKMGLTPANKNKLNITKGSFAYPRNPLYFKDNAPEYNVIFIVVDSLRGDMITPEVMPFTSKFASENAYFKNHFSNGNCTRIGVFSLFSGIIGTYWHTSLERNNGSILIDSLIRKNYQTGVFFSAALTNPEFDRTIFANVKNMTLKRKGISKIDRDNDAFSDFKTFISKCDKNRPILGVLMYDALHGYEYPKNMELKYPNAYTEMNYLILRKNDEEQKTKVKNLIRNATSFSDIQLKETIEFLKKELDWEKTIIVITSDHGNECNEANNNLWGHNSKFSRYQLHVPLILAGGPVTKGTFSHRTFHVDIVPTLLNKLGCGNDFSDYSSGKSLFDKSQRDLMIISSYSNRALLYDDIIYEMTKAGVIYNYTLDEKNVKMPPDNKLLQQYLKYISHFTR